MASRTPVEGEGYRIEETAPPQTPNLATTRVYAPQRVKRPKKPRNLIERLELWDGLVPPPERPEGFWRSLLYPLWGATGLVFLLTLPVMWWFLSLPLFGYLHMLASGEAMGVAPIRALVPSIMGLIFIFGYTLLFLSQILFSSAMGEVRHPRPPDAELWEIVVGLVRWIWAILTGALVGGVPSYLFLRVCEDPEPWDWALVGLLVAIGTAYAGMALLVTLLFEDPLAANPVTVVRAIYGMGWPFLRPCLVGAVGVGLAGLFFAGILMLPSATLALAGLWAFWVFALYEAMVVMRLLGREYGRRADALGWFRDPTRPRG